MKKLFNSIKYDLKLNLYNKSIVILTLLTLLTLLIVNYNMLEKFNSYLKLYNYTVAEMQENGEDIEELMNQEVNVYEEVTEDGAIQQYIDNPLKYDYDNLKNSLTYISGINIIVGLLENSTLVFLGLIGGLYMIYFITYEFSEKTIKTRLLIDNPIRLLLSKIITGILIITVVYFSSLLISGCISCGWSKYVIHSSNIDMEPIKFGLGKIVSCVMTSYLITLMFSMLGCAIGLLLRKMSLSILFFLVLHLIVPSMGKYDYKNLILSVFSNSFELDMGKRVNFIDGVGLVPSVLIFLLYIFIILIISMLVYILKKRKGDFI